MKVSFERVLEYLRDAGERGVPLHPGFPPTAKERMAQDQLAILTAISEQVEANRLAIQELQREMRLAHMPEWQRLLHEMADHCDRKLPILTQDESGQAPGG